ncbi:UNKNOWN [Stylonychia lemnae]|uniref:Uncharacterized protein n=1 Tax=Stylonychia lemnae TaxID=5949 RepID=A0A078BF54_STYLE|nr:UNKNOWN [Stylonychia lemnae]|eukprot:CDW91777.1 UNKNOWN [Stylonychia lemnae]
MKEQQRQIMENVNKRIDEMQTTTRQFMPSLVITSSKAQNTKNNDKFDNSLIFSNNSLRNHKNSIAVNKAESKQAFLMLEQQKKDKLSNMALQKLTKFDFDQLGQETLKNSSNNNHSTHLQDKFAKFMTKSDSDESEKNGSIEFGINIARNSQRKYKNTRNSQIENTFQVNKVASSRFNQTQNSNININAQKLQIINNIDKLQVQNQSKFLYSMQQVSPFIERLPSYSHDPRRLSVVNNTQTLPSKRKFQEEGVYTNQYFTSMINESQNILENNGPDFQQISFDAIHKKVAMNLSSSVELPNIQSRNSKIRDGNLFLDHFQNIPFQQFHLNYLNSQSTVYNNHYETLKNYTKNLPQMPKKTITNLEILESAIKSTSLSTNKRAKKKSFAQFNLFNLNQSRRQNEQQDAKKKNVVLGNKLILLQNNNITSISNKRKNSLKKKSSSNVSHTSSQDRMLSNNNNKDSLIHQKDFNLEGSPY